MKRQSHIEVGGAWTASEVATLKRRAELQGADAAQRATTKRKAKTKAKRKSGKRVSK